jgi:hypothetical protein
MIMAENAVIRFNQSNQLIVTNADGVVQAGITGGEDGDILIWSGGKTPAEGTFKVYRDGTIEGTGFELVADGSGHLANGNISWDGGGNTLIKGTIRNSESPTQFVQLGSDGAYPQIIMLQSGVRLLIGTEAIDRSTPMVKLKNLSNPNLWSELRSSDFRINSEDGQSVIFGGSISVLKSSSPTKFTVSVDASDSILRVVFVGLPTSPTGLTTGQLYKDANGFLKVV